MSLSDEAQEISLTYDRHAGAVRRWIMRNPNTMFWASVGATVAACSIGRRF